MLKSAMPILKSKLFLGLLVTVLVVIFSGKLFSNNRDIPIRIEYKDEYITGQYSDDEEKSAKSDNQILRMRHSERIKGLLTNLDETFLLDRELTFIFGGDDGPLFDPSSNEIWMPASFIIDIEERFRNSYDLADENELQLVIEDVMLHTLVHEMGHALVEMYGLPILGREEDAVDGLGSVILIETVDDGQTAVITAADMFALESEDIEELEDADFWGHHSLDEQRYYALLCHVYGSDPDAFEDLIGDGGLGAERAEDCVYDYPRLVDDWYSVLEPYMAE